MVLPPTSAVEREIVVSRESSLDGSSVEIRRFSIPGVLSFEPPAQKTAFEVLKADLFEVLKTDLWTAGALL